MSLKKNKEIKGFSLLELISVMAILSFMILAIQHSFNGILMRQERELTLDKIRNAIEFAKQEAARRHNTITICGSHDQKTCHQDKNWSSGFIIIEKDEKEESIKSPLKIRVLHIYTEVSHGKLLFSAMGNGEHQLHIRPNGTTFNQGTFTYCPKNGDSREAMGFVINHAARGFRPFERNSLGILLKSDGHPLECS